ncbi:MAG: cupin domain-containing protein [Dongiaceae bacterium]
MIRSARGDDHEHSGNRETRSGRCAGQRHDADGLCRPRNGARGPGEEKGHTLFASRDGNFLVGVWECSPCKEKIDSYRFNEFCQVLAGAVTVTDRAGHSETYRAGDSFFMQKRFAGIWHMTETFRKYFAIYAGD